MLFLTFDLCVLADWCTLPWTLSGFTYCSSSASAVFPVSVWFLVGFFRFIQSVTARVVQLLY